MDVRCDKCGTEYEFDDARIGGHGVTVKCTNCGFVFKVHKEASRASRDWLVRKADNQIIAFRQLTTLQKWIVEGRIDRKDEISRNGETWKKLGNIGELEPFFSVFDKAQALNDLMSTGSIGARPVVVNGSEILATMNPLGPAAGLSTPPPPALVDVPFADPHSLPPEPVLGGSTKSGARRGSGVRNTGRSQRPRGPSLQARPGGTEPVHQPEPPTPSTAVASPRAALDLAATLVENDPSSRVTEPPPAPPLVPTSPPAAKKNGEARLLHSAPPAASTGLAGPGALRGDLTSDLSLPPEMESKRSREGSEIVRNFRREQRNRRMLLLAVGVLMIGLGGGAAFAVLGPEDDNPLRALLETYQILPRRAPPDTTAEKLETAYRDFELDTAESLTRAERALAEVSEARPAEPAVRADRALVLMTQADALRRGAARKDEEVREHKAALSRHQIEVQRRTAIAERNGEKPVLPDPPESIDLGALESGARADREQASSLLKMAFDLAKQAHVIAPSGLQTSRALAEYYRVQRDQQGLSARHLEAAKEAARTSGTGDAITKYIEAASLVGPNKDAPASSLLTATNLLEEALTMRPTMLRARVLLARVLLLRTLPDLARAELERVSKAAPEHAEAALLLAQIARPKNAPATAAAAPAPETKPAPETPAPEPVASAPPPAADPKPARPAQPDKDRGSKKAATKASTSKVSEFDAEDAESKPYQDWIALGDKLRRGGDARGALAAYEKAADRRLNAPQAYAGMGWSYLDQGKTVAGLNAFKKSLTINARFPEGHLGKGVAFRKLGRRSEAMAAYRAYLDLAPNGNEAVAARHTLEQLEAEERAAQAAANATSPGSTE